MFVYVHIFLKKNLEIAQLEENKLYVTLCRFNGLFFFVFFIQHFSYIYIHTHERVYIFKKVKVDNKIKK
jgi:hypothetical protein